MAAYLLLGKFIIYIHICYVAQITNKPSSYITSYCFNLVNFFIFNCACDLIQYSFIRQTYCMYLCLQLLQKYVGGTLNIILNLDVVRLSSRVVFSKLIDFMLPSNYRYMISIYYCNRNLKILNYKYNSFYRWIAYLYSHALACVQNIWIDNKLIRLPSNKIGIPTVIEFLLISLLRCNGISCSISLSYYYKYL